MAAQVILNPYAGRWSGRQRWAAAADALHAAGVAFELAETTRTGQARELARAAALAGRSPIIVAGGDGTVGEVVNGLAQAADPGAPLGPIGILALGTANDTVDTLGIPRAMPAAAQVIARGATRPIDLGEVNRRLFVNNSAIGLEPYVTLIQQRIRRIQGPLRYLLAALRGVAARPHWDMRLEWDGGRYEGPISLIAIGNGPRSGGIFYMAPHANPADGTLALVYGYRATRLRLLSALPRTLRSGKGSYVELNGIHIASVRRLHVSSRQPTPVHADGEVFDPAARELTYAIWPGRLRILC